ncbi:unnamed protein product [Fusarium graminearum]|uniref:Uncharacterized protein n=1 Tax=Gibberella zeae TaxID=5518 RepID=A0A9N8RMY9_GIBZA|nr:unnamed protein product [Fusarium graminearum]
MPKYLHSIDDCVTQGQGASNAFLKPGKRVSLDFHNYPIGLNGYTSIGIWTYRETSYCWDYYFTNRLDESLLAMLRNFTQMLQTMYNITKGSLSRSWLAQKGIKVEKSAPRTRQQNGSGERSGGVVKEKVRLLMIDSNLPSGLCQKSSERQDICLIEP